MLTRTRDVTEEILDRAAARGREKQLPYGGAVTPEEAWTLVESGAARLLDVRTKEEWTLVGRIPGAEEIEWKRYPSWQPNPDFLSQVRSRFRPQDRILLVCRSAQRSHDAATQLAAAGFRESYNVLEGFEGDKNASGQRVLNGWRVRGLPWYQ
ncbi:MAG TPA: rhodanese-like domain-containing protein [Rhodocyclaceae bacterium]